MNLSVILSSFFSALLGAMGLGGGTVLIIYLTGMLSLEQKEAQGINLVFFLTTGLFASISNKKNGLIEKKALFHFLPLALAGLATGFILLPIIPADILRKLFGGILLMLGLKNLFDKKENR